MTDQFERANAIADITAAVVKIRMEIADLRKGQAWDTNLGDSAQLLRQATLALEASRDREAAKAFNKMREDKNG